MAEGDNILANNLRESAMFEIDATENRISRLEARTFSKLKFRERENLQEWLANAPDALGEELLIIQKEFDGFAETRERLDLLALDKNGTLVIVENKLDDTGRDVVWQALKYAAYCSSLKKSEVIKIFQDYLLQQKRPDDASELICDFLEVDSIDEVNLNSGSSQRFILVAANFRKEVTSAVLWLISNGIKAQCIKATPFTFNDKFLLDITQIIPTPEAEDYIIKMSSKDSEEKEANTATRKSHQLRLKFWRQALDYMHRHNFELYRNINPTHDHWLSAGSGMSGCTYALIFGKVEARVEFNIAHSNRDESKRVFDFLHERREEIEARFENTLDWDQLDDRKACRVRFSKSFDGYNEESWPAMIEWLFEHIQRLEIALKPIIPEIPR